jgi:hypothetical protein
MLFLAEHAELSGAVNEFGRCGTHYVIIIMPKHEDTRAMTINMFEGTEKPRGESFFCILFLFYASVSAHTALPPWVTSLM